VTDGPELVRGDVAAHLLQYTPHVTATVGQHSSERNNTNHYKLLKLLVALTHEAAYPLCTSVCLSVCLSICPSHASTV